MIDIKKNKRKSQQITLVLINKNRLHNRISDIVIKIHLNSVMIV
jgi:hypothetical protein